LPIFASPFRHVAFEQRTFPLYLGHSKLYKSIGNTLTEYIGIMGSTTKPSTEHINSVMNESVAEQRAKATIETVKKEFEADDALRYLKNDSFSAGPASLLGKIFYEKEGEPTLKRWALSITPKVDEASVLKEPITRMELIVENKVAANIEFLSFLSSSLSSDEIYEVKVIDNAVVRLVDHGEEWEKYNKRP